MITFRSVSANFWAQNFISKLRLWSSKLLFFTTMECMYTRTYVCILQLLHLTSVATLLLGYVCMCSKILPFTFNCFNRGQQTHARLPRLKHSSGAFVRLPVSVRIFTGHQSYLFDNSPLACLDCPLNCFIELSSQISNRVASSASRHVWTTINFISVLIQECVAHPIVPQRYFQSHVYRIW